MSRFKELLFLPAQLAQFASAGYKGATVTDDVTIFNWTGTNITSMTPTRVDTGVANTASGGVTFDATDTVAAANMQVAIRALGGIYALATVTAGVTADNMLIRIPGGYNITWAQAGGVGTFTESGAAGSDTAVVGKVVYARPIAGNVEFAEVKKVVFKNFNDAALLVAITDAASKTVFGATIDTSTAGADTPYVRLLTADGVAGEDGAAAANASSGVFTSPLTVSLTANAPVEKDLAAARNLLPRLSLTVESQIDNGRILKRTSGARATQTGTIGLGAANGKIKRIRLFASADNNVAPTVTDADGLVVYDNGAVVDYTTAVLEQLVHDGVDQAGNAVADLLDVVAKSPLTISGTGLGSGTFTIDLWTEV